MKTIYLKVEVPDGYELIFKSIRLIKEGVQFPLPNDILWVCQKEIHLPTDEEIDMQFPPDEINRHIGERIGAQWLKSQIEKQ